MNKEETIQAAFNLYTEDEEPFDAAIREVLRAGLAWFDEFRYEAPTYDDGRPMSPDRMYTITPEGRATLQLAEAVLGLTADR